MLENLLFNRTKQPILQKALDAYSLRLNTTSNNIANISTKGYKSKKVNFEMKLIDAMESSKLSGFETSQNHMKLGKDKLEEIEADVYTSDSEFSNGVNNVDIDHEMVELGKVQINNTVIARAMSGFFGTLDASIKGQRTR